jgi:hypothetical protein
MCSSGHLEQKKKKIYIYIPTIGWLDTITELSASFCVYESGN